MLAQRPHRRLEILVVRRLGDREVKGEVRVLAVGLRLRRSRHQRQRRLDLFERRTVRRAAASRAAMVSMQMRNS